MTKRAFKRSARYPAAHKVDENGLPDCDAVKHVGDDPELWKVVDDDDLPPHTHDCPWCQDVVEHNPNDGTKIVSELSKMDPEDLGLSPMGERT